MSISIKELLEAGAHFGHQTHRWNPKMRPFIYGARNGIYIINLEQTKKQWNEARNAISEVVGQGQKVLFVGTKPQAQEIIREESSRSKQFHVNKRWLGGMLTNFKTIKSRIDRMDEIDKIRTSEDGIKISKKDMIKLDKEYQKLEKSLLGIKEMRELPGMLLIVDPKKEHIAIKEAKKLRIPVVAITDTNCDPEGIDYVVPSNDDALKAIRLFLSDAAEACISGEKVFEKKIQEQTKERLKAEAAKTKNEEQEESSDSKDEKSESNSGPEVVHKTLSTTSPETQLSAQGETK